MNIGGFQKLTLLDYPGEVACIVFTNGCDFRCPFCHNAGLILPEETEETANEESILNYLKLRKKVLEGVVVTGGEPLLQPDLAPFLRKIRALGYKIKLDTNGSFPEKLKALLDENLLDYVAMDVKHTPEKYEKAAGVPAEAVVPRIEKSLAALRESGIPFELRTTVVRGIHTREDILAIAKRIGDTAPYYLQSYVDSEHIISPEGLSAFPKTEMESLLAEVKKFCPSAVLRN